MKNLSSFYYIRFPIVFIFVFVLTCPISNTVYGQWFDCRRELGHEKALEKLKKEYTFFQDVTEGLQSQYNEVMQIYKKIGEPNLDKENYVYAVLMSLAEGKISEEEATTFLTKAYMYLERKRLEEFVSENEKMLNDIEDCIDQIETEIRKEKKEAYETLDEGKVSRWTIKSGYPKNNPTGKDVNYENKQKTFKRDVSISESSITVHEQKFHGSTKEVTSDWNFTFSIQSNTPDELSENDKITVSVTGNISGKKQEGLPGCGVGISWKGFELVESESDKADETAYVTKKKTSDTKSWTLVVPEGVSELELNIYISGWAHAVRYIWEKK